ncbi:MAG: ATP-binding protein [Bacteroidales bacterium]|nr:ATP-binding protein [Bacteroidales bacterium]
MEHNPKIIGRKYEQEVLQRCVESPRAEFIAVYGRRRIGKTFLVKQYFNDTFDFYISGIYKVPRAEQLKRWQSQLNKYSGKKRTRPKDWFEAFDQLCDYLETHKKKKRLIVFIDELPWMDTPKSGFLRALEVFWNTWGANRNGLKLVVCGSATTWMTNKLLGDKGGLHNRVTRPIRLAPFTLKETERYLKSIGLEWSQSEVLDTYMILGGTPYYLSLLRPELSLRQNIDELFFGRDAVLKSEYEFMFSSLFNKAHVYRNIVECLSKKLKGLTRRKLVEEIKIADSGMVTEALDNLEKCDFIRRYKAFGKRQRDVLYQLTDMYTLFYLRFVKGYNGMNEKAWSSLSDGKRNSWAGYAFEQVCLIHLNQIKKALGISGIASDVCSWNSANDERGAQVDLVIDRSDKVINLCEMKYTTGRFELTRSYAEWMSERKELFRNETNSKKTLHLTLITPYGIVPGKNTSALQNVVTIEDLFEQ